MCRRRRRGGRRCQGAGKKVLIVGSNMGSLHRTDPEPRQGAFAPNGSAPTPRDVTAIANPWREGAPAPRRP
jgi:hypothetical protein